jgi:hypothetical protein
MRRFLKSVVVAGTCMLLFAPATAAQTAPPAAPSARVALPDRLSDVEFWKLVSDISEPGGYFQMDNFTSNEMEIGRLFTMLRDAGHSGGVYMGVGPEQNFTYIAAVRPKMAFIVDIRRQAVMQHLMYKAIFELSKDRADFISFLFSRPRPARLDSATTITVLWDVFTAIPADSATYRRNSARIIDQLTKVHGFSLTADETQALEYVYGAFYNVGPTINSRGGGGAGFGRGGGGGQGNFIMLTSGSLDAAGEVQSFLSTEANFRVVKALQEKNLIVPASGNFGGPKAIRTVGAWLKDRGATVTAYYVSNVEQYLFQDNIWRNFYGNVATLPVTEKSVFIRPYAPRRFSWAAGLCPIGAYIKAFDENRVAMYDDSLRCAQ